MLYILDRNEQVVTHLANHLPKATPYYEDLHVENVETGVNYYTFKTPFTAESEKYLKGENFVLFKDNDNRYQMFVIKEVTVITGEDEREIDVYAEHIAMDELLTYPVRPVERHMNATQAIEYATSGSGWKVYGPDGPGKLYKFDTYQTAKAAVRDVMTFYDVRVAFEVEMIGNIITKRIIRILPNEDVFSGKTFTYEKDLKQVTRHEDTTDVCTALIGVGKGNTSGEFLTFSNLEIKEGEELYPKPHGQDFVADRNLLPVWGRNGRHQFGIFVDDTATSEFELFRNTAKELQRRSRPQVRYTADVYLFDSVPGYKHDRVRVGNTIVVKDHNYDPVLAVSAKVIELQRSYTDPERDTVTFGDFKVISLTGIDLVMSLRNKILANEEKWAEGVDLDQVEGMVNEAGVKLIEPINEKMGIIDGQVKGIEAVVTKQNDKLEEMENLIKIDITPILEKLQKAEEELQKSLQAMEERQKQIEADAKKLVEKGDALDKRAGEMEKTSKALQEETDAIKKKAEELGTSLGEVKKEIETNESSTRVKFETLDKKVNTQGTKLQSVETELKAGINGISGRVTKVETGLNDKVSHGTFNKTVTDFNASVKGLEGKVISQNTTINAQGKKITEAETKIQVLDGEIKNAVKKTDVYTKGETDAKVKVIDDKAAALTVKTNAITGEVNSLKTESSNQGKKITEMNTKVEATAKGLESTVKKGEVYTKGETDSKVNGVNQQVSTIKNDVSSIKQEAGRIATRVQSTETQIKNLNATNLLEGNTDYEPKSGTDKRWHWQAVNRSSAEYLGSKIVTAATDWASMDYQFDHLMKNGTVKVGDILTMSVWGRLTGADKGTREVKFYHDGNPDSGKTVGHAKCNEWQRFSCTFKVVAAMNNVNYRPRFEVWQIQDTGVVFETAGYTLNFGSKDMGFVANSSAPGRSEFTDRVTKIEQTAKGIETKVTENKKQQDLIGNRVSTAETKIQQNATAIGLRAEKKNVYTKGETDSKIKTVSDKQASLEVGVNGIKNQVSQVEKTVKETITGGDNLLTQTDFRGGPGQYNKAGSTANITVKVGDAPSSPYGKCMQVVYKEDADTGGPHRSPFTKLVPGRTYSWSIWMRADVAGNINVGAEQGGTKALSLTTSWQQFTHTFKATDTQYFSFVYYKPGGAKYRNVFFHSAMLVEGNKPAAWALSSKDTDQEIISVKDRASKLEIDAKGIRTDVTKIQTDTKNNTTWITNNRSKVDQTAEAIKTTVRKNEVISQINQTAESIKINAARIDLIGKVTANMLNVNEIFGNAAVINKIKAIDISADRIKGGTITGVTYKSADGRLKIESNRVRSFGPQSGGKGDYAELTNGGLTIFEVAPNGSPFGNFKTEIRKASIMTSVGSRKSEIFVNEFRSTQGTQVASVLHDVVPHGDGYGLKLQADAGVEILAKNADSPAIQFQNYQSIIINGWGNIVGNPSSNNAATWSIKDANGRVKYLTGVGKDASQTTEYSSYGGGHAFNHNGTRLYAMWIQGANYMQQFGNHAIMKWQHAMKRFEFRNGNDTNWSNAMAGSFQNASSLVWKKDITNFEDSALDLINKTDVMTYRYKDIDVDEPSVGVDGKVMESETPLVESKSRLHVGVITEFAPEIITDEDGTAVDLYAMISLAWKGIQELDKQNKKLQEEIESLRAAA